MPYAKMGRFVIPAPINASIVQMATHIAKMTAILSIAMAASGKQKYAIRVRIVTKIQAFVKATFLIARTAIRNAQMTVRI